MPDFAHRFRTLYARQDKVRDSLVVNADSGTATMRLYDAIDSWGAPFGVSASEFADALDQLPAGTQNITLHINSPGGEVFEGVAILNALRNHPAKVTAVVDGIAASAASFIAVGVDETVMARNSELMIHDAWGVCIGNAEDMRTLAGLLDHHSNNIASIYADKTGDTPAAWRDAMTAESWYSATEAVAAGLADRVDTGADGGDAKARYDLSIFTYAGRGNAPAPTRPVASTTGEPDEQAPDPDDAPETPPEPEPEDDDFELRTRALEAVASAFA